MLEARGLTDMPSTPMPQSTALIPRRMATITAVSIATR
jgi:hypothetical protein